MVLMYDKYDWVMEMVELFAEYNFAYGDYAYQLACAYWDDGFETPEEAMSRYIEDSCRDKVFV